MEMWIEIRKKVLVDGVSKRRVLADTGIHWKTLQKILTHSEPPGYRISKVRSKPKMGLYLNRIREIIMSDEGTPQKQRRTAKRIFEQIQKEGYRGGYSGVKYAVHEIIEPLSE